MRLPGRLGTRLTLKSIERGLSSTFAAQPTGTPDGTKFYKDDGTWATPTGGVVTPLRVVFQSDRLNRAWTNMPSADTVMGGDAYGIRRADLTNFTQVRLIAGWYSGYVAGATGSKLRLMYDAANLMSVSAANYTNISASACEFSMAGGSSTWLDSGWVNLAAGAKADVTLVLVGSGGDGVADPTIPVCWADFR